MSIVRKLMLILLVTVILTAVMLPANAVWPEARGLHYPQTVWSDMGRTGSVTGRVTVSVNGTIGIGGAYVSIVNAANVSEEYYNTTSDAYGNYQITGLNATYSSVLMQGPLGQAGNVSDYYRGTSMYKIYANKSPYGEGYSAAFGIDANYTGSVATSVVIFPKPARIELNVDRPYVAADGMDYVTITATMFDMLGNPVADGYRMNFTVGDATGNAWNGGFAWSVYNGSLNAPGDRDAVDQYTRNNSGMTTVRFGWVPENTPGNYSMIWAYFADDPSISASIAVTLGNMVGSTIYVPADYPGIQEAINAARPGDTVIVSSGTYYENVVVDKAIILLGVDTGAGMPVVDGGGLMGRCAINVTADDVFLQGFTVTDATDGITVYSRNARVSGNTVYNVTFGITLNFASDCSVRDNTVYNTSTGISAGTSYNSTLSFNRVNDSNTGIYVVFSNSTTVEENIAGNNGNGILAVLSDYISVIGNVADANDNEYGSGIILLNCPSSIVMYNVANNNGVGIGMADSDYCTMILNTANDNSRAGMIISASSYINASGNTADNNTIYGLMVSNSSSVAVGSNEIRQNGNSGIWLNNSTDNTFWLNRLSDNGMDVNATDASPNSWNSPFPMGYTYYGHSFMNHVGNYWGNYTGPDADQDGIGDTPYTIADNNVDHYPMITAAPVLQAFGIVVTAGRDNILANGSDTTGVSAYVTDIYGDPVPDGSMVVFEVACSTPAGGSLSSIYGNTSEGMVLNASTTGGYAWVRFGWSTIAGPTTIIASSAQDMSVYNSTSVTSIAPWPDALYVADTIPENMTVNKTYTVSVTLRNTGTLPWTNESDIRLGSLNGSTGDAVKYFGTDITYPLPTGITVDPGEQYTWNFTMRPTTAGTFYPRFQGYWSGYYWFGEILTQPVTVTAPLPVDARYVRDTIPDNMVRGRRYDVSITLLNTGTTPWTYASNIRLGSVNGSSGDAMKYFRTDSTYRIPAGVTVNPGEEYTWRFTMRPTTVGTFYPQFREYWYGHYWFGETLTHTVRVTIR